MPTGKRVRIVDAAGIDRALERMTREILERNESLAGLAVVGIRTRGVPLARRLARRMHELGGSAPPIGLLDINLYRDDLSLKAAPHPVLRRTEIPFEVDGSRIVLVDDVLFTGRTIRAALDGLMDLGRPEAIQLAVLVDRGHRELPIHADYVGHVVTTAREAQIQVRLAEIDGKDEVLRIGGGATSGPREEREVGR
jgi:pyrimidine operon attenuation protein/uracil phosphoribosyltransferase